MFAHMYGTLHCIGMDAHQNGQHLTLQVTLMQLKIFNQNPFVLYGRLELNTDNKTLYMELSILILPFCSLWYMTHLERFIYDRTYRKLSNCSKPQHIKMPDQRLTAVSRSELHAKFEQRPCCDT